LQIFLRIEKITEIGALCDNDDEGVLDLAEVCCRCRPAGCTARIDRRVMVVYRGFVFALSIRRLIRFDCALPLSTVAAVA